MMRDYDYLKFAVRFGAPEGLRFYSCFRTSKLFLQLPNTPPTGSD